MTTYLDLDLGIKPELSVKDRYEAFCQDFFCEQDGRPELGQLVVGPDYEDRIDPSVPDRYTERIEPPRADRPIPPGYSEPAEVPSHWL